MPPPIDPPGGPQDRTLKFRHTDGPIGSLDFDLAPESLGSIGDYELLEEVGVGGMGRVFKARHKSLGRIVALKTILSPAVATESAVQRLRKEAEAAAQLDHPGIVPIYKFEQQDDQHFFTMALVDGRGLDDRLCVGPLDNRTAALVVQRVAEAVAYAHRKGVVHRDLKPANVLLDREGGVKVTDFGIARRLDVTDMNEPEPDVRLAHPAVVGTVVRLTQTGAILGTPGYMAPEQATASEKTGPLTDVWALGALLYACLTGRPPFRGSSPLETLALTVDAPAVPPNVINPDADLDLVDICLRCLRKEPEERFPSADAVAEELLRWREGHSVQSPWTVWRKRTARLLAGAPELVPLLAGLVVHRLGNIQEGIFVGFAIAGISLVTRRQSTAPLTVALSATVLFLLAMLAAGSFPDVRARQAAGLVSAGGLLAGSVTVACGLAELKAARPGKWSPVRVAAICLPIALIGLSLAIGIAVAGDRWRATAPAFGPLIASLDRNIGRVASWFLAVTLGLALGALLGRTNQMLDRLGREPVGVFPVAAALSATLVAWAFREFRSEGLTETSRFSFLGPGPAMSFAEDRTARWLAAPGAVAGQELRWAAAAGIYWLKFVLITGAMALGGLAASAIFRVWNAEANESRKLL